MNSNFVKLHQLLTIAEEILPFFLQEHAAVLTGEEGVYMMVSERNSDDSLVLGKKIGWFHDKDGHLPFMSYAAEKLTRPEGLGDWTSFKTQNYSQGKYGGRISTLYYNLSISGFEDETLNHKFGVAVLKVFGDYTTQELNNIEQEFNEYQNHGK